MCRRGRYCRKSPRAARGRRGELDRSVVDMGQAVPEPMAEQEYSGKPMLRLSRSLHRRAAEKAHAEGVSLNQFIVITLAERMGAIEAKAITTTNAVVLRVNQTGEDGDHDCE